MIPLPARDSLSPRIAGAWESVRTGQSVKVFNDF
jgi:hypothetical protein